MRTLTCHACGTQVICPFPEPPEPRQVINCPYCNTPLNTTVNGFQQQPVQNMSQMPPGQPRQMPPGQSLLMLYAQPRQSYVQSVPVKKRVVYQLLALFLGGFGVHNFYSERIIIAVIQLIITVVGLILFNDPQIDQIEIFIAPIIVGQCMLLFSGVFVPLIEIFAVKKDGKGRRMG